MDPNNPTNHGNPGHDHDHKSCPACKERELRLKLATEQLKLYHTLVNDSVKEHADLVQLVNWQSIHLAEFRGNGN